MAPLDVAPGTNGVARQGFTAALMSRASWLRSRSLARLTPMEFFLCAPYRSRGAGMRECALRACAATSATGRSEEHTSELQSLMRISYAVFCLKKKKKQDS